MKPAVHCLLVVLVFGVVIGEDQLGAIAHERGNVVRERRSPFLSFPGGGFGVGVRYDDTRYRSIPDWIWSWIDRSVQRIRWIRIRRIRWLRRRIWTWLRWIWWIWWIRWLRWLRTWLWILPTKATILRSACYFGWIS
uniref:Uncharacterized protein n=1 Tax=Anopheles coluzzii TaxID=1518534 RepID=A0A8W7PJP4_ANOCL